MKNLIIIGAGGFGREVLEWANARNAVTPTWEIKGFLDDNLNALEPFGSPLPVLGSITDYQPQENDEFIIALGNPATRMRIASRLEKQGYKFATLVHPNAVVGSRCTVGEGTVICPFVCVTCDVKIGRHVILNVHAVVGHDAIIGDGCTINPHCDITGWVTLGEGVLMGAGATIMPKLKVGAYSVIGSGSAPYRNVDDLATMVGIPAKKIFGHEPIVIDNWQPEPGP